MENQNYKNYRKYYPPHHFFFLPLMSFLSIFGFYKSYTDGVQSLIWCLFAVVCFCILFLAIMLRQHYALGNQNRIVRLEFRLRYFQMTGKNSDDVEAKLSFGQIAALRFAGDAEFSELLNRCLTENTDPSEIKKSIKHWKPDNMRV